MWGGRSNPRAPAPSRGRFALATTAIFALCYRSDATLWIHSIITSPRGPSWAPGRSRSWRRGSRVCALAHLARDLSPLDPLSGPAGPSKASSACAARSCARAILGVHAAVAQLARASACHAEGREFESLQPLDEKPRSGRVFLLVDLSDNPFQTLPNRAVQHSPPAGRRQRAEGLPGTQKVPVQRAGSASAASAAPRARHRVAQVRLPDSSSKYSTYVTVHVPVIFARISAPTRASVSAQLLPDQTSRSRHPDIHSTH